MRVQVFPFQGAKSGGAVSGCRVTEGNITRAAQYRVLRNGATVFTGRHARSWPVLAPALLAWWHSGVCVLQVCQPEAAQAGRGPGGAGHRVRRAAGGVP